MKRMSWIFLTMLLLMITVYYVVTAIQARRKAEDIMSKFEEVNKQLDRSSDSLNDFTSIESDWPSINVSNKIILLIDSLTLRLQALPPDQSATAAGSQFESDIKRLVQYTRQLNTFYWNLADSRMPDTVAYWGRAAKFSIEDWYNAEIAGRSNPALLEMLAQWRKKVLLLMQS